MKYRKFAKWLNLWFDEKIFAYLLQVREALFFELKPRDENIWDQVSFGRIKPMFLGFIFGIDLKKK